MNGTSKTDDSPFRIQGGPAAASLRADPFPGIGSVLPILIGTCSWCCSDWRGNFYPQHLSHTHWLEYYAQSFSSVEVDSTFYQVPSAHALRHWLECTPEDFIFSCKMSRQITHERRLRDCKEELHAFLSQLEVLQPKLGPILIQLPPYFTPYRDELALKSFLTQLPREFRFAVEFRKPVHRQHLPRHVIHADWHHPHLIHFFQKHGVCWVWNDLSPLAQANRAAFEFVPETTNFLYVRLMGDLGDKYTGDSAHGRLPGSTYRYGSLRWPRDESLENWAKKIGNHLSGGTEGMRVYAYINNHFEGSAPLSCQRLARQFGISLKSPAGFAWGPELAEKTPEQLPLL